MVPGKSSRHIFANTVGRICKLNLTLRPMYLRIIAWQSAIFRSQTKALSSVCCVTVNIKRSSTYTRVPYYACHIDDQGVCQSGTCGFWSTWRTSRSIVGSERVRSRRHHSVPLSNFRLNHRQLPAKRHQHQV